VSANARIPLPLEQISGFWWGRLPVAVSRLSRGTARALADGIYLSAHPLVGAVGPAASLVAGVLIGWQHFTFGETFTGSLVVMGGMLAIGIIGAGLGTWLLVGYMIGDFFLFSHPIFNLFESPILRFVHVRVPLLLSYVLLAQLLVSIPLVPATIRRGLPAGLGRLRGVLGYGLGLVVLGSLVYLWTHAVPTLIRPVFTWKGGNPPIDAIQPLQHRGRVLIFFAMAAMVVRIALERSVPSEVTTRAAGVHLAIAKATPLRGLRPPVRAGTRAVLASLLLAGIVDNLVEGVILPGILFGVFWGRDQVQTVLPRWAQLVSRVPVLVRLIAGFALGTVVATQTLHLLWRSTGSFFPILLSVVLSLVIFAILIPPTRRLAGS
jgi:hypothetical protein